MPDIQLLTGIARRVNVPNQSEGDLAQIALNNRREQIVSNGLPVKTQLTALGQTWSMMIPTASAFTNVAGMPTTRAELALYNGEPAGGKTYVIEQISFLSLTSITAAANVTLIYQNALVAALTDNTAVLINSTNGKVTYPGLAKRALAVTTMTANKWTPIACAPAGAAASIGLGVIAEVAGGIIVPPGYTLGVNAVVGTAVGTSLMGIVWSELDLPTA